MDSSKRQDPLTGMPHCSELRLGVDNAPQPYGRRPSVHLVHGRRLDGSEWPAGYEGRRLDVVPSYSLSVAWQCF